MVRKRQGTGALQDAARATRVMPAYAGNGDLHARSKREMPPPYLGGYKFGTDGALGQRALPVGF